VGAISVHGVNGLWGVLSVGIFASGRYGAGWNLTESAVTAEAGVTGILYDFGLGIRQLGAQAAGAVVICTVMLGLAYVFFRIQHALIKDGGIRSKVDDELEGLDGPEMGVLAYPEDHSYGPADVVPEQLPKRVVPPDKPKTSTPV
jgi:Amt family ammonium transporter